MHRQNGLRLILLTAALATLGGCAGTSPTVKPEQPLDVAGIDQGDLVDAAKLVLSRMQFAIEKADRDAGIVQTKPLPGAQFFEFWRSDSATLADALQSNIHSTRRSVEVTVDPNRDPVVRCIVRVQRLSLPSRDIAGVSQAYLIHSQSEPDLQTFRLTPRQQAEMTWIDLDDDDVLAARILEQIGRLIAKQGREGAS